jgi:hypothetical protein
MKKQLLLLSVLSLALLGFCGEKLSSTSKDHTSSSSPKISDSSSTSKEKTKYSINSIKNLSTDFFTIENTVKEEDQFVSGATVKLTLDSGTILSDGFTTEASHLSHIYINVNGINYKPSFAAGVTFSKKVDVTFPMPEANVDIVACYSVQQHVKADGYSVSLVDSPNATLYGVDSNEKYDYLDCYFITKSGFKITSLSYAIGESEYQDFNEDTASGVYCSEIGDGFFGLTVRPNGKDLLGDVKIKVIGKVHSSHAISYTSLDEDYIIKSDSTLPSKALESDTVNISVFAKSGCYVKNIVLSNVPADNILSNEGNTASFIMPDNDVSVSVATALNPTIEIGNSEHVSSAKIYDSIDMRNEITSVAPSETFDIYPTLEENYLLLGGYINGENYIDCSTYLSARYLHFTMPKDITKANVTFKVGLKRNVTIAASENGSIALTSSSAVAFNDKVAFTITPATSYTIDTIRLTDSSDVDLDTAITFDEIQGEFIMPDKDVKIVATFKKNSDSQDKYTVKAITSSDQYTVKDGNFKDLTAGEELNSNATFFFSVANDDGNSFWVYATMADKQIINQQAKEDEDTGEYTFQKSFNVTGDVKIYVSDTEVNAKALVNKDTTVKYSVIAKVSDSDEFTVKDYQYKDLTQAGITYVKDSTLGFTVSDDLGNSFWVVTYVNDVITIDQKATEDEESGEYSFSTSFAVTGNVKIKVASTQAAAKAL